MFDNVHADWARYLDKQRRFVGRDFPSFAAIVVYRYGHWCATRKNKLTRVLFSLPYFPLAWLTWILTSIQIPKSCQIGAGFRIHHWGLLIINGAVIIGKNCTLRPGVVIGNLHDGQDVPIIGDNFNAGVGAKILGAIRIGNNVSVGANAVVVKDVPDNCIALGVPAKYRLRQVQS